jgi:hypothetical protein
MVRYFYALTPIVIVFGAVVVLTTLYLALVALLAVSLVALATLAWAVVFMPYMLSRAISRRLHVRIGGSPQTAAAQSPARRQEESVWHGAPSHPSGPTVRRDLQAPQHNYRDWADGMSTITRGQKSSGRVTFTQNV